MVIDDSRLEVNLLKLLDDFERLGEKAYFKSIRTVLRGGRGERADLFLQSRAFNQAPSITAYELEDLLNRLFYQKKIIILKNESNGRLYYRRTHPDHIDGLICFDQLLGINTKPYDQIDETLFKGLPMRGLESSTVTSNKQFIDCNTLLGVETIFTESELEKEFIQEISKIQYAIRIKEQPRTIAYTSNGRIYTPDFLIQTYQNRLVYVEVKAYNEMTVYKNLLKLEELKEQTILEDAGVVMISKYKNEWINLEDIRSLTMNQELETEVLKNLNKKNKFTKQDLDALKGKIDFEELDIHKIILHHNLKRNFAFYKFEITKI
ncbi:hypothetical protein JV173_00170 [Acholeplasma equirhinis]|uniref:TnsA endonuclease N-terminal domain-containing protein n=1 Tax=Acholeplasma equirhinis TaxID=555393 RepID=UPI00197AA8D9|nr:TnsA endonuclease N-terminal domain-containing protein [Acholeplasma equirhinis]MBN3489917.1 hypothetical protein [Acholeplasma equirhinis]